MSEQHIGLSTESIHLFRDGAYLALLMAVIFFLRKVYNKLAEKIGNIMNGYPVRIEAEKNREIYNELVELRAVTDADRVFVFRFHNGMEFLPSHPAWKLSRTHEVVKHGVTYESGKLQGVLVSLISNIVFASLTGTSSASGIKIADCAKCLFKARCTKENKRVIILQTAEMDNSYCKFFLEGQNVKTAILCGIAKGGKVYGMVGADFTGVALNPDQVYDISQKVCKATDKIKFNLQYKKDASELPIPEKPITQ